MAAKVRFNDMISSVSGVIKRERMEDGLIRSIIVRKNGTMYTATHKPRTKLKETEQQSRKRFSILCGAYTILCREMKQTFNTITRKEIYARLKTIYDKLTETAKNVTAELIASIYAYEEW